jgi:hypothetical protein
MKTPTTNPAMRDYLSELESYEVAQEFWATRNNAWVLVIPVVFALALIIGAIVIL